MKNRVRALALAAVFLVPASLLADEVGLKARTTATGATCRGNSYFDIVANVTGDKVEGTFEGSAFQRGPLNFSGQATATSFTANYVFAALNNLRVDISGTKIDADTWNFATKWNGGGPSNCESVGQAKKA
jgi:hypothetical protein